MVTCWERADLVALLYVMFYYVFVTFPRGVLGQVWCLIASIPDMCLYFTFITTRPIPDDTTEFLQLRADTTHNVTCEDKLTMF